MDVIINSEESRCSGCTACSSICPRHAIELKTNSHGFLVPFVNTKLCVRCGECGRVCPLRIGKQNTVVWQEAFAVFRNNGQLLAKSQSGGAFSVLAERTIKKGGVVFGVKLNKQFKAEYARVCTLGALRTLRGSKYVQAFLGDTFATVREDLICGREVLFAGTPCHVHGLLQYLAHTGTSVASLVTVDLICHGVASPLLYEDYKSSICTGPRDKIVGINFRDKRFGWGSNVMTIRTNRSSIIENNYMRVFFSDLALRSNCYNCKYACLDRVGDISIGDCWGIQDCAPDFYNPKGVSLLILNSQKGRQFFDSVQNHFRILRISVKDVLQKSLREPTVRPDLVDAFWRDYSLHGYEYACYKYCETRPGESKKVSSVLGPAALFRRKLSRFRHLCKRIIPKGIRH